MASSTHSPTNSASRASNSLGHGLSDKPTDAALYAQEARAGDAVAVIDDLGYDRAHLVGYSMGGWISVGVAKHYRERLSSLTIGGWDIVNGVKTALPVGPISFEEILGGARAAAPELFEWVTPEVEPGLAACWSACGLLEGASEAVLGVGCPVLIWDARDDPFHDLMKAFAATHALPFLSTPGDHVTTLRTPWRRVRPRRSRLHGRRVTSGETGLSRLTQSDASARVAEDSARAWNSSRPRSVGR